jgi:predicted tellurium resistance membrane protein TerC
VEDLFTPNNAAALLALTSLEIVLGIDNVVFLSILTEKLHERLQPRARQVGLALAMLMRIALLFVITWVMRLDKNVLFSLLGHPFTGKHLVLMAGGLFLIFKATVEIHGKLESSPEEKVHAKAKASFWPVIAQVVVLDAVFSLDSVITAVGMSDHIEIMVAAVVISVGVMMIFAGRIADFIKRHPTTKMLALCFLLLIGVTLVVDGWGMHFPKGFIYFAMAFALAVEVLNLLAKRARAERTQQRS